MNIITVAGHLGADPEVRFTSSGQKVTTLRMAVKVRKGSADDTIWYRVTVWGEQFDKMISFLKKGSAVVVVGSLNKPEIFTDRNGNPQISMGITASSLMFSPFGRTDKQEAPASISTTSSNSEKSNENFANLTTGSMEAKETNFSVDDEIPF